MILFRLMIVTVTLSVVLECVKNLMGYYKLESRLLHRIDTVLGHCILEE